MRHALDVQMKLDLPRLQQIEFDRTSRHELEPILMALKHLYDSPQTLKSILKLIAQDIIGDRQADRGRLGLLHWEVLVFAAVRLGCDLDYDALSDLANQHRKLRRVLGVGDWQENTTYPRSTLQDNLSKLTAETLQQISNVIVAEGHRLRPDAAEKVRGDSVVVQTNIHYPTDANLLVDGIRKVLSTSAKLGRLLALKTWQHWRTPLRLARKHHRRIQKIGASRHLRKTDKQERLKDPYQALITQATDIALKAFEFKENLNLHRLQKKAAQRQAQKVLAELEYYLAATTALANLAERRVLNGETIPHEEKIFSLFEPHTELINRGKVPFPIEFGHRVLFVEDQIGFIVDFRVLANGETDEKNIVAQLRALQKRLKHRIKVVSLDKGYWSPKNLKELQRHFEVVCLPKKGHRTGEAQWRESTPAFRHARQWHPGIESAIHALVSANGLAVCRDKGEDGYHRYVALGVLGRNLHTLGRILLAQARAPQRLRRAA